MDDAGLDDRLGKDGCSGFGKALQAIDDSDQDVLAATTFQLVHHQQPALRPFRLFDPEPEDFLAAIRQNRSAT
ncbi:hypothetical protein shn_31495 (plasmid) [Shinella sp. HZN7]|nr:hypothetical protein shn_31495 [Shinella sp. HZN7]